MYNKNYLTCLIPIVYPLKNY